MILKILKKRKSYLVKSLNTSIRILEIEFYKECISSRICKQVQNFLFGLYICGHELVEILQAVIGVRGIDEARMGMARLIHDLHPSASAPFIRQQQTIPDLKIGTRSLPGLIYVQKR